MRGPEADVVRKYRRADDLRVAVYGVDAEQDRNGRVRGAAQARRRLDDNRRSARTHARGALRTSLPGAALPPARMEPR